MNKCIPIVSHPRESYRSPAESLLDYYFYLSSEKIFQYRTDWVEKNYEIFLRYHTLAYYNHSCDATVRRVASWREIFRTRTMQLVSYLRREYETLLDVGLAEYLYFMVTGDIDRLFQQ